MSKGGGTVAPQWRIVADKMLIKPTAEEQRLKREKREGRERERILREERKALALQEGLRAEDKEFYR